MKVCHAKLERPVRDMNGGVTSHNKGKKKTWVGHSNEQQRNQAIEENQVSRTSQHTGLGAERCRRDNDELPSNPSRSKARYGKMK
ncbi:hypothetical protein DPMN_162511 [Dreissena polymorpha]|uniref:Uncharacterized protein n=1 Tax=Dreissena polymorpha TaxID=45954 RepID=A0A9D4ERT2_DREPO|nr:hypothetical protein DPMN_162511 [Dreissena polymorpha]